MKKIVLTFEGAEEKRKLNAETIVLTFNGAEEKRKLNAETIANYVGGEVYTGGTNCNENFCNILGLDELTVMRTSVISLV